MQFHTYEFNFNNERIRVHSPPQYTPLKIIAKGAQGIAYKAFDNDKSSLLVIKQCIRPFAEPEEAKRYCRELDLHSIVNHKNIIRLEAAYTTANSAKNFNDMYLVTEYMDCSLYQFQKNNRNHFIHPRSGEFIGLLMHSLLSAVSYLHQKNLKLIHRDITPANILLRRKTKKKIFAYILKLADFGLARQIPEIENQSITKHIGTMPYRAPEIMLTGQYRTSVDLWSIGCILYEMITDKILFRAKNNSNILLYKIIKNVSLSKKQFNNLPEYIIQHVLDLKIDYSKNELGNLLAAQPHVWTESKIGMEQFNALLLYLLEFDPQNRITAAEALSLDMWDSLKRCKFYDFDNPPEIENELIVKYDDNGNSDYYKQTLFNRLNEYQAMISNNSNS